MLDTIDTTSFTSTFQDTYTIKINNELNNLTGVTEATVTIEVAGLETKNFTVQNIVVNNVPAGCSAAVVTQQLTVKLRGGRDVLDDIIDENITAVADLSDIAPGTAIHDVPVKIRIDGSNEAGAIGTYTVTVSLVKD